MLTMNCAHCGKPFAFSPASTRSGIVRQFADGARDRVTYFPTCTHCGKANRHTVDKK